MSQLWIFPSPQEIGFFWLSAEITYCTTQLTKKCQRFNPIPIKIPMAFVFENKKISLKIHTASLGIPNRYNYLTLQYLHKERQTSTPMIREFLNKPLHTWSNDFWQGYQDKGVNRERIIFSTNSVGKTAKEWSWLLPYTI